MTATLTYDDAEAILVALALSGDQRVNPVEDNACVYRDEHGAGCAIATILDGVVGRDWYDPGFESESAKGVLTDLQSHDVLSTDDKTRALLNSLQMYADGYEAGYSEREAVRPWGVAATILLTDLHNGAVL